jgi:Cellulase (glycosyl hydrolase family 5)
LRRARTVQATAVRTLLATLAAMAALLASGVPAAGAAPGVEYGLTDDAWLANGPGTVEERVTTLQQLGVGIVRYTLRWDQIASTRPAAATDPQDPAYAWSTPDDVLDTLHAHGLDVVLQIVGTPSWANGGKPSNYLPASASSFAAFATAAATRYPWVRKWLIWNEPNQARWLRPTSPTLYVTRLLNPAYAAIHAHISGAVVGGGGTAPRGSTDGVSPVAWLTAMHRARARLDAYAHNPYPLDPKRETPLNGGCTHCTTITMATLGRLETLVARYFPRARIWLTEYGYQTNPPDRFLGVSKALQARYLSEAAYVAWRAPRVDMLIHFLYRDEPELSRFQSGLETLGNVPKPALDAFQLPLAETSRRSNTTSLWGQLRSPEAASTGVLETQVAGGWKPLATVRPAGEDGFFRWHGTLPRGSVVRLRSGTLTGAPLTIT